MQFYRELKYYRRVIKSDYANDIIQILTVTSENKFYDIWSKVNTIHVNTYLTPKVFKIDDKVPKGFYKEYGFKRYYYGKTFFDK
jgi:hypothetical protein